MKTFMPGITLGKYLAGVYVFNLLFLMAVLLGIIYLFDTVELLRRAGSNPDISLATVLQMGLLKLPDVGQVLFPFAILFSAMFTFWQLNRRSELIVLRSAGFSVWQFILPLVAIVLLVGVLQVTVINPLGALLITKYEQLETRVLKRQDSSVALFQEGLWLRQSTDGAILDDDDEVQKGYVIVHARRVQPKSWSLQQVTVFYFGQNDSLLMRVDAPSAELEQGRWIFNRAKLHRPGIPPLTKQQITLPTTLTTTDIEESFASPESVSFWSLPSHIQTLEQTGFDANRLTGSFSLAAFSAFDVHGHGIVGRHGFHSSTALWRGIWIDRDRRRGWFFHVFRIELFTGSWCVAAITPSIGGLVTCADLLFARYYSAFVA